MSDSEKNQLLEEAKKEISDPDVIVSVYDLTFQWISTKLGKILEYTPAEIVHEQTMSLHADAEAHARKVETEIASAFRDITKELQVKTKKGTIINITFDIHHFEHKGDPYMVGKVVKVGV
jgi:hypothetical protein